MRASSEIHKPTQEELEEMYAEQNILAQPFCPNEVLTFISKFVGDGGSQRMFTCGWCYWFAHILVFRFDGDLMYNAGSNHFATEINGRLYDIMGERWDRENFVDWDSYRDRDSLETERIVRDCINKE